LIAKQIEDQLNTAEAQNIFNDETGALAALKKSKELLASIPDKRSTKSLKQQLTDKINTVSYGIQRITYLEDPALLTDFSKNQTLANIAGLALTEKVFWGFDNTNKNLLRWDSLNSELETRASDLSNIDKLSAIENKNLILLTQSGEYYKYEISKDLATKISKPAKDYFETKNPTTISPLLDPPLASSTIAMSIESSGYSLFLDSQLGKLIIFDKNGILKKQQASAKFVSSTAFSVSIKDKKGWIFNNGNIYQIDLGI
jgi:hypothetical protein